MHCPYLLVPISDRRTSNLGLYTIQSDFQLRADGYTVSAKAAQYLELIKMVQYFNLYSKEFFGLEFKGSKCPNKIIWLTHTPFRYLAPVICNHLHVRAYQCIFSMYSIIVYSSICHRVIKHRLSQSLSQSKVTPSDNYSYSLLLN